MSRTTSGSVPGSGRTCSTEPSVPGSLRTTNHAPPPGTPCDTGSGSSSPPVAAPGRGSCPASATRAGSAADHAAPGPRPRADHLRLDHRQDVPLPHRLADHVPTDPTHTLLVGHPEPECGHRDISAGARGGGGEHVLPVREPLSHHVGYVLAEDPAQQAHTISPIRPWLAPVAPYGIAPTPRGHRTGRDTPRRRPPGTTAATAT